METRQWQDKLNLYPSRKSNPPNPGKRTTFSMMAMALSYSSNQGSKIWQFRYIRPVTKKRAKKSIAPYPSVTLADARNYRAEARVLLAKQIDPQDHQQEQLRSSLEAKTNTFQLLAERWWNVKKASVW